MVLLKLSSLLCLKFEYKIEQKKLTQKFSSTVKYNVNTSQSNKPFMQCENGNDSMLESVVWLIMQLNEQNGKEMGKSEQSGINCAILYLQHVD